MTRMADVQLTLAERTTLLALMACVKGVSNKELHERYGFDVTGSVRANLVRYGYLTSSRSDLPGHPYIHELTELGWRRAREEFGTTPPGKAQRGYRVLFGVLNGFDGYLRRSGIGLAEVFPWPDAGSSEEQVRAAYAALAEKPGASVGLRLLRERLDGLSREEFDAALLRLIERPGVYLEPEPKLRSLTAADRAAAVNLGGEAKHLLSIEPA